MITPSVEVEVFTRNANAVAYASDNDTMGAGKIAYEQLTHKADVVYNVEALDGVPPMTYIVPYRSAVQGTVARSTIESEDPVDALCKPVDEGGIMGKCFQFHDTISLAPVGTTWEVPATVHLLGTESEIIGLRFVTAAISGRQVDVLQFGFPSSGDPVWQNMYGDSWANAAPIICFKDGVAPDGLEEWIYANADPAEPPAKTCYKFNDTVDVSTPMTATITGSISTNGQAVPVTVVKTVQGQPSQLVFSAMGQDMPLYNSSSGWVTSSAPVICVESYDPASFIDWLEANSTPYTPPTVSGCWKFKDSPDYDTDTSIQASFTSNGQTWNQITVGNGEIEFSKDGADNLVVYTYNSETYHNEWVDEAYKNICFTEEAETSDAFYNWLNSNATKVN